MDEVTDPNLSIVVEGFFLSGPKSHILNKIEDTCVLSLAITGQRNNITNKIPFNQMFHTFPNPSGVGGEGPLPGVRTPKGKSPLGGTRVKAASRIGPHNLDVISVIVGSLLGDCYANKRSVEGTRLCYRQSTVHKDYLF
jgi:hypothetical protein